VGEKSAARISIHPIRGGASRSAQRVFAVKASRVSRYLLPVLFPSLLSTIKSSRAFLLRGWVFHLVEFPREETDFVSSIRRPFAPSASPTLWPRAIQPWVCIIHGSYLGEVSLSTPARTSERASNYGAIKSFGLPCEFASRNNNPAASGTATQPAFRSLNRTTQRRVFCFQKKEIVALPRIRRCMHW